MKIRPVSEFLSRLGRSSDVWSVLGFLGLLIAFYPDLFLAKSAALMGDHWEQHYPWAVLMAQSLKQGIWPFWTPLIQCGFPIVAESQIGLFYLPNLILYSLLPIQWAYAYMNLLHFFIAGVGTYFYARKAGLGSFGAFIAAVVFVFGTGYGGAYYNITSLKTLSWMPWILFCFERFLQTERKRNLVGAAFLMALSILAGYLQVAALMLFMLAVYLGLRLLAFPTARVSWQKAMFLIGKFGLAFAGGILLALPQLVLTYELAQFSNRVNLSEGYAYVGSLFPAVLWTLVFPNLQGLFRGACLYSGIFSIFFIIAAFVGATERLRSLVWLWTSVGLVALFLAFGQWSPLYVALIKATHFYSFRIPAKFLIFFCFASALLAGAGAHVVGEDFFLDKEKRARIAKMGLLVAGAIPVIWAGTYAVLSLGRSWLLWAGEWVVRNFIYGQPGHPKTMGAYLEALSVQIDRIRGILSLGDPWVLWAVVLILIASLWLLLFRNHANRPRVLLSIALLVLVADLYVLAGADIKKDFATYSDLLQPDRVVAALLEEKADGRVARVYGFRRESENLPMKPSVNMLYGIEDIGGYSPLIFGRYFETIGWFGNVNDSNQMREPGPEFVLARLPLLNALDVSHILSTRELTNPALVLIEKDPASGALLYRNQGPHARAWFISGAVVFSEWEKLKQMLMAPGFDPQKVLLLEDSEKGKLQGIRFSSASKALEILRKNHAEGEEVWSLETTGPGFFILSTAWYPGWEVRLNGQKAPLLKAYGLFQAVQIPEPGSYQIEFTYAPLGVWGQ